MPASVVYDAASRKEVINDLIFDMADRSAPFIRMLMETSGLEQIAAVKYEWVDKNLVSFRDELVGAITSTTQTTITVRSGTTSGRRRYIDGKTIIEIDGERMLVTSTVTVVTNSSQLVVTRAQDSTTTIATGAVGTRVDIISAAFPEGFEAGLNHSQFGVRSHNFVQIFSREVQVSDTSQSINAVGAETMLNNQIADVLPELMKELQIAALKEFRREGLADNLRRMGGLKWWVQNSNAGANNRNAAGSMLDFNLIDQVIEEYMLAGGDPSQLCMIVPPRQQRKLNDLKEARLIQGGSDSQSEMRYTRFINRYDFGSEASVEVMQVTDLSPNEIYLFQKDCLQLKALQDKEFYTIPLSKTGYNTKELAVGEYTLQATNPDKLLYRYYNLEAA